MPAGRARAVVAALMERAGSDRAIKLKITANTAQVSVVRNGQAVTWAWQDGRYQQVPSDIKYLEQSEFDPLSYAIGDPKTLFSRAANISGSIDEQQLQIVEYNQGIVLMTVTTNPESQTVFFRKDGTLINRIDFDTPSGLKEALQDTLLGATQVLALGIDSTGFWVDVPGTETDVVERRTRPTSLPIWRAARRLDSNLKPFDPTVLTPALLSARIAEAREQLSLSSDDPISLSVDRRDGFAAPLLRFESGGRLLVLTLNGVDVTKAVS